MKPNSKQSLKIELMPDNKCLIEITSKENSSIQSSILINHNNKSIISSSKDNENKSQNDLSNLNDSDILSISKTDSSISNNSNNEIKKQKENNSNMLISFSNISEAKKTNINFNGASLLTNSIIFNKYEEIKEESFTPTNLCNYYQKSNNNTPINNNTINKNNYNENNEINLCGVNQKNLNSIFSEMNNYSKEKFNVSKKKTPIKYTKSQLSNNDENNEIVEKKNIISLFEKSNNINLNKNNQFQIIHTNNIEILNDTSSTNSNFMNRCSYFSFFENKNNNKQSNTNNLINIFSTKKCNNENNIFDKSNNISPKFNYSLETIEQNIEKINDITQQTNINNITKNNQNPEKIHRKEHSCSDKNSQNSLSKNSKYLSIYNLTNRQNNGTEPNNTINKIINENELQFNANLNKKNIIKKVDLKNQIQNIKNYHSSNQNKNKSKEKKINEKNDISQLKTMREKIENIISKNISLLAKKPFQINNRKSPSPSLKTQRPKSANKTINFINNIKPLSFISNNIQNIELKDIMKAKIKYSRSPNIRNNNLKNKNLRRQKSLNKNKKVIEISPSITHNNSSSFCETNSNLKTITNINNVSNSRKPNQSPSGEILIKKNLKVIQNFSKYKKRSVINQIEYNNNKNNDNYINIKNKTIISNKDHQIIREENV